jgi:HEAT repeat protein
VDTVRQPETAHVEDDTPLARATADLCSGNVHRVRGALLGEFMDLRLVPHLITLLDHPEHAEDARMELRWLVPRVIGQLTDALLDADQTLTVRQRIPAVMEICHNPRVVQGLLEGLADGEFNVRYASARALARMRSRDASLVLPTASVYAAVRAEVNVDRTAWRTRSLGNGGDAGFGPNVDGDAGEGASLSLDHVFTLLGLVLDRDALHLALQALSSDNRNLRGTALEYLDNVLPEDLRRRLWRHLGIAAPPAPTTHRSSTTGEST